MLADAAADQQPVRLLPVRRRVRGSTTSRAPRDGRSPPRRRAARSARSWRVTAPLTRATRGRSVRTSTRPRRAPEDLHRSGRGPQPSRCHLEQRRLARPVRPEDHPTVAGVDPPVDAGQHRHTVAADRDACRAPGRAPVAPARSRPGASDVRDAPVDAADEAGTALRPCPLAGQPEPELAPVTEHDPPGTRPRRSPPRPEIASGPRARPQRRRRPSARRRARARPGRRRASARPAPSGSSGTCSTGTVVTVNDGCRRAGDPCRRRRARALRIR